MIREFEPQDADAVAALQRGAPWIATPELVVHWNASAPPRARRATWVAEHGGDVVAWAEAELAWATERRDLGELWVLVRDDARRRGFGTSLHERCLEHLMSAGAVEIRSGAYEDDGHRFLRARGYRAGREERFSAVDPRTVDTSPLDALATRLERDGLRLASLAEVDGLERSVYELYAEAAADSPADEPQANFSYEEWLDETLGQPKLSRAGSFVVLAGERAAALAFVSADLAGRRAEHEFTGTLRAFRRRGLARAVKLAAIRWCAEQGVQRLMTGNDATNVGMLAINDELGYRPWVTWTQYARAA